MIFKFERKFVEWFNQNLFLISFVILVVLSVLIRVLCFDFASGDMNVFLLPWVEELNINGFNALRDGVGNYNIPYLLILLLAAKLPIDPVYTIKFFSVVADYILAAGVAILVYRLKEKKDEVQRMKWTFVTFLVIAFMPTVIMNSAVWGQCDSIYAAFGVWSVYFAMRNKFAISFILFAIGFTFKLQIIFLFPFFLILYFVNKKFSLLWFLTIPIVLIISAIPSAVQGGSIFFAFDVYLGQTAEYSGQFKNYPNITVFLRQINSEMFSKPLIFFTIAFFLAILTWLIIVKAEIKGDAFLLLAAVSVLGAVNFLPTMHERYAYIGELLLWAWFLVKPERKRLIPTVIITAIATLAYMPFLLGLWAISPFILAIINIATFGYLVWRLVADVPKRQNIAESPVSLPIENCRQE